MQYEEGEESLDDGRPDQASLPKESKQQQEEKGKREEEIERNDYLSDDDEDEDEDEEDAVEPRLISVNKPDINFQQNFADNYVSTTKYKLWNFIPKNLFEQFRRVANIYFLIIALITLTPISPVKPGAFLLALIVVLGATAIKEGLEDWVQQNYYVMSLFHLFR